MDKGIADAHSQLASIPTLANIIKVGKEVKFIAHRGLSSVAPENTIPAYIMAGKAGFWGGEADVVSTLDGQWVLMHDNTVDRTTNGTGAVASMTLAQIKELIIDSGNNVGLYPNLKVPTFEEYLLVCKKYALVPVIEIKSATNVGDYETLVNQIKKYGYEENCIINSFSLVALQAVRELSGNIILQLLASINQTTINQVKSLGNAGIDVNESTLTKENIELAHSNGIQVNTWTVDNYQRAKTLIGYGVDFIATNIIGGVF